MTTRFIYNSNQNTENLNIDELREKIIRSLDSYKDALDIGNKDILRELHSEARNFELCRMEKWIRRSILKYGIYFANGKDVVPSKIKPIIVEATEQWHHDLFRLARLTWSLPYTQGFGRRIRFLIFDDNNECLIGLIGLQSPPIDLSARDRLFKYPEGKKTELINQTMDIYTLGAVPPYSFLLGGKLIALLASSTEVWNYYKYKYLERKTLIEGRLISPNLVALTTTSAYGKSSLYNRLKVNGRLIAEPIGFTEGYGTFHLTSFYSELKTLLINNGIYDCAGFGNGKTVGPHPKWQHVDEALKILGIPNRTARLHGVRREVYLYRLINNLEEYLSGKIKNPEPITLNADYLFLYWRERWMLQRLQKNNQWRSFNATHWLKERLLNYGGLK